jgi:hypothetical protein
MNNERGRTKEQRASIKEQSKITILPLLFVI